MLVGKNEFIGTSGIVVLSTLDSFRYISKEDNKLMSGRKAMFQTSMRISYGILKRVRRSLK
jgi:hypothetical protein